MTLARQKILHSFGRASKTYDRHAVMQVVAANQLARMLPENMGNVCELGCGTGLMTRHLVEKSHTSLLISDIAPAMLNIAKSKFPTANTAVINAQYLPIQHTDTIVSNMTLQWSDDIYNSINTLSQCCDELYFSVPLSQSMQEWRLFCQQANIQDCLLPLPELSKLLQAVPDGFDTRYIQNSFCLYYASWLTFWQSQKRLGTNIGGTNINQFQDIRGKLLKGPIKVTYEVCCIAIKRKGKV